MLVKMKCASHEEVPGQQEPRYLPPGAVRDLEPADAERALAQGSAEPFDAKSGCAECEKQPRGCCSLECYRGMTHPEATSEEYFEEMVGREAHLREQARAARDEQ